MLFRSLTIHKSQGSEFDAVDVVLPERPTRLVVRELIYTAVTRPRKRLRVWSSDEVLAAGIAARTVRHSGLNARVHEAILARTRSGGETLPGCDGSGDAGRAA